MDCHDSYCWSYNSIPDFPPPPPLPNFLKNELEKFVNNSEDCGLCSWAGVNLHEFGQSTSPDSISLGSLLVIVALVSGIAGASITGCILSFKRLRNRKKFESNSDAVRHLARKCNDTARVSARNSSSSSFATNTISENTYCEDNMPYNYDKDSSGNNIYAELHPSINSITRTGLNWRPPFPPPNQMGVENCYLELNDIPKRSCRCSAQQQIPALGSWFQSQSQGPGSQAQPSSNTYYSDLDLTRQVRPL